jgi:N-acetyl-alpha-D-glucosaminyl L-malate synthase BshA
VAFSINQSDGITTVSESLKKDTCTNFDIQKDITVIPNFIDFTRFTKLDKEHFKKAIAPNNEKVLIHTSNFRKVKRVEDTIKIFKRVREKVNSKLLLVGDGPERAVVEELARLLAVEKDVLFLGKQDAVEELLAIADLYLMPSESESFGLAALEAMACEVPVISSNTGGIPEINIEGATGFLSEVGDVEEMAENAIKILVDEQTLSKFKSNALNQAKRFDIQKVLPQYESYYEEVLASHNQSR